MRTLAWVLLACCDPPPEGRSVVLVPPPSVTASVTASASAAAPATASASAAAPATGPSFYDVFKQAVEATFIFPSGSAVLPSDTGPVLDLVAKSLAEWPRTTHVNGDAEPKEPPALAVQRAKTVIAALVSRGVPASSLAAETRVREHQPFVKLFEDDGRPLALKNDLFHACCDKLQSANGVRWWFATDRADSKLGRELYAAEEARCAQCDGKWESARGLAGLPGCACKYSDGGKTCSSPSDCRGPCDIGWQEAIQQSNIRCPRGAPCSLVGKCREYADLFGCQGWITEDKSGVRHTQWICQD